MALAGELLGWAAGAGAVALWVADGSAVAVGGTVALGEKLALLLGTLMLLLGEKLPSSRHRTPSTRSSPAGGPCVLPGRAGRFVSWDSP